MIEESKGINVAICIGCNWEYMPIQFFQSYVAMHKSKHSVVFANRGRYDDMRNNNIKRVLKYDEFTHLLFLDIDHYHHPDTLLKLINCDKDIVSGLSFRRGEPYDPIMFKWNDEEQTFNNITEWEENELVEVDAIGAASLLVKKEVFEKLAHPWFEMNYKFGPGVVSEDFAFCLKAKENGYKVWCDTSCTNKHIGTIEIDQSIWERHNNGKI